MDLSNTGHYRFSAIVAAAGSSTRMDGADKLFADLGGLPVIIRTLKILDDIESVDEIILVISEKNIQRARDLMEKTHLRKLIKIIEGGNTRQKSVYAGVIEAKGEFLVIHDGARPFVTTGFIRSLLKETSEFDAVIPAIPVVDTIKRVDHRGMVNGTIDRTNVFQVQTPQIIRRENWIKAYEYISKEKQVVTDDASMLESAGFPVKVAAGSRLNIKITVPDDIILGEMIIKILAQDG